MMAFLKRLVSAKLRGERGESITEVLVAIVVSGLAILMLGTVIATAVNVNKASQKAIDEYYAANNDVAAGSATATGTVGLASDSGSITLSGSDDVSVSYRIGEQADGTLVISYVEQESGATG